MKWEKVELGDAVSFRGGGTPRKDVPDYWADEIPWATVKDFKSLILSSTLDSISQKGLESSSAKLIPAGHVIIPTRMALGKAAINTIDLAINQDLRALIPKKPLDTSYLLHSMLGLAEEIERHGSGATVKGITHAKLSRLQIPLPPLAEQKRIAGILDAADALRARRRESLAQLDTLLQATFLDMFGDPVLNPMGWELTSLAELIVEGPQNGLYKPAKDYGSGTRILRIDGFYNGIVTDIGSLKRVRLTKKELDTYSLSEANIVINRVNSREYLGKSALVPPLCEPVVFESNMMRMRVDNTRILPQFAVTFLQTKYIKNQISAAAKDAVNQSSINQKDVKNFRILVPPLDLQRRFAAIVEAMKRQKARQRAHLAELDTLFAALQQRAFAGDL